MTDETFVEQDGKDESTTGIASTLIEKMKQNKEGADKKEEEKKSDPTDLNSFIEMSYKKPTDKDDVKD